MVPDGRTAQAKSLAKKDGAPFGSLASGTMEEAGVGRVAVITTDANELVATTHDRMPAILAPGDYARWLGEEPDPRDLMRSCPAS